MADWRKFIDPSLQSEFDVPDTKAIEKLRKRFNKMLDSAVEQLASNKTKVPNRMWKAAGKAVAFSPKFAGAPVLLDGEETVLVPVEEFSGFVAALKQSVEAGEFDAALEKPEGTSAAPAKSGAAKGGRSEEANARAALSRYLNVMKMSLEDAKAAMIAKAKYSEGVIAAVVAERKG